MPSAWSKQENEAALDWLERLRAVDASGLDESYRRALADFLEAARQKTYLQLEHHHGADESAALGAVKDSFLRLGGSERAQFIQWLRDIGETRYGT